MKVVNLPVETNGTNTNAALGPSGNSPVGTGNSFSYQVQLLLDNQVQVLLQEISQMLQKLNSGLKTMPEQIAGQVQTTAQQPLIADTAVPQGLTVLFNGPKISTQNLKTYTQNIDITQTVKEYYPTDLPKAWNNLFDKLDKQLATLIPKTDIPPEKAAEQLLTNPQSSEEALVVLDRLIDQIASRFTTVSKPDNEIQASAKPTTTGTLNDALDQLVTAFTKNLAEPDLTVKIKFVSVLREAIQQTVKQLGGNTNSDPGLNSPDLPTVLRSIFSEFETLLANPSNNSSKVTAEDIRQLCQQLLSSLPPQDGRIFKQIVNQLQTTIPHKLQTQSEAGSTLVSQQAAVNDQPEVLLFTSSQSTGTATAKPPDVAIAPDKPDIPKAPIAQKTFEQAETTLSKNTRPLDQQTVVQNKEAFILLRFAANRGLVSLSKETLQQTKSTLQEITSSINRPLELPGDNMPEQSALGFAIPLYIGDTNKPYPAFIHVYRDTDKRGSVPGGTRPDTWLRLYLATENIGFVDLIFHIYGENELNIRATFADNQAAEDFKECLSDIRTRLNESPLNLSDISVNYV
jgi:hypothetical protein